METVAYLFLGLSPPPELEPLKAGTVVDSPPCPQCPEQGQQSLLDKH